ARASTRNQLPWSRRDAPRLWWRRSRAGSAVNWSRPMDEGFGKIRQALLGTQPHCLPAGRRCLTRFAVKGRPIAGLSGQHGGEKSGCLHFWSSSWFENATPVCRTNHPGQRMATRILVYCPSVNTDRDLKSRVAGETGNCDDFLDTVARKSGFLL